jgi:filamentous hemagglutinin family protein
MYNNLYSTNCFSYGGRILGGKLSSSCLLVISGAIGVAVSSTLATSLNCAIAQITPDATLPNNSTVKVEGNTRTIEAGTRAGGNLFHSFGEFSVPTGSTAIFNNAQDIQNIISRVTGKSVSNIDGLIRANGTANLFLLNPSGIIFGKNASLNIGGSFVATTANAIQFGNQGFFNADNPNFPALLTVNPSALLFNQIAAASIQNNSVAPAGKDPARFDTFGLRVLDGKSLLLVGGNISMDGGRLNAFGGRVELGGVAGTGTVGLNVDGNNLSLSFPQGVQRADVSLINRAQVNVRKDNGGSIAINARNLELLGGSSLRTGIESGLGSTDSKAGNIEVNATGAVNIRDRSFISNAVLNGATGKGGDINISTGSFTLTNAAFVITSTSGQGDAGSVTLQAQDRVAFINGSNIATSSVGRGNAGDVTISTAGTVIADALNSPNYSITGVQSNTSSGSEGNAGNIYIKAASVSLANGANIRNIAFGRGKAGDVSIQARDNVSFDGVASNGIESGVFSNLGSNAVGRGGNIKITAGSLSLRNDALLVTSTFGQGDAGNIIIDARDRVSLDGNNTGVRSRVEDSSIGKGGEIRITTDLLSVTNGAQLSASTFGQGDAGNIIIDARARISFDGTDSDGRFSSGAFSSVRPGAVGKGGSINITTGSLSLTRDATVSVSSFGDGTAGEVQVQADSIRLDTAGIYSETTSGDGGDITLNVQDFLLLRRDSQISTTAGTDNKGGNGGNITINAPSGFIVAVPKENSNITANAFKGSGGKVQINAAGIFGLIVLSREDLVRLLGTNDLAQLDLQRLPSSITAISQTSPTSNGQVTLNTPDVDPSRGLVQLPTNLVDASGQIDTACTPGSRQRASSFVATGRGGLPLSPTEPLQDSATLTQWVRPRAKPENPPKAQDQKQPTEASTTPQVSPAAPIVEANGWVVDANGDIVLVAQAPNVTPRSSWQTSTSCTAPQ